MRLRRGGDSGSGAPAAAGAGGRTDSGVGDGSGARAVIGRADAIVPGKRLFSDEGMDKPQGWLSSLVACVTLLVFVAWIHILMGIYIYAIFWRATWAVVLSLALLASVFMPAQTHWPAFLASWVFKTWRHYFEFSAVFDAPLDPTRKYVFAELPHGVYPFGPILAGTVCDKIFPNLKVYAISASNVFWIPGIRHVFSWMGALPATRKNFAKALAKPGAGVAVIVDGLAGMYVQDPKVENVVLQNRRGFIKVALTAGADLVPVYHMGNTRVLSIIGKSLKKLSRKLRFSFLIQYGRFGLPMARRVPIMMAIGKPIPVTQMNESDDKEKFHAEVERLHKLFVAGLIDTYKRNRTKYDPAWEDLPIQIVA